MNLRFKDLVRHNRLLLSPAIVYSIPDEQACQYFINMGWADVTSDEAIVEIGAEEVAVSADTVYGDGPKKGQLVVGETVNG